MHLTGTLNAMNFSLHDWTFLTHLFPRYYVAILILFLTEPKIVEALILLSLSARVLSPSSYFSGSFVLQMFGVISTLIFVLTLG